MELPYDVFLSYNHVDQHFVEAIAHQLQGDSFVVWLDKWRLTAGAPWIPAIGEAIDNSKSCAVFFGSSETGGFQKEEIYAAIERRATRAGENFRVIPVLLPGAAREKRSSLPAFLSLATWVEFEEGSEADALYRLKCGIRGVPPGSGSNP